VLKQPRWGPLDREECRVPEAMALVIVDIGVGVTAPEGLAGLTAAFRDAGLPVVHAVEGTLAADLLPAGADVDRELLRAGGVQTLGPSEMAIGLPGVGAFDATPLDALLRALSIDTLVFGGPVPSAAVSASVRGAQLRGFRALLATDELAVTLGAHLSAA
jgi:nicotinamidase-related amidase